MANKERRSSSSPLAGIIGLVFMLIIFWIVWSAVKGIWAILSFASCCSGLFQLGYEHD